MKRKILALAMIALVALIPMSSVAEAKRGGTRYYGSGYTRSWRNGYGYGINGGGYYNPQPVQWQIDSSCAVRTRNWDTGEVKETVMNRQYGTYGLFNPSQLWSDETCKAAAVATGEGLIARLDVLAWSRNDGNWHEFPVLTTRSIEDLMGSLGREGKITISGNVITYAPYSRIVGLCYLIQKNLQGSPYLAGTWTLNVVSTPWVRITPCTVTIVGGAPASSSGSPEPTQTATPAEVVARTAAGRLGIPVHVWDAKTTPPIIRVDMTGDTSRSKELCTAIWAEMYNNRLYGYWVHVFPFGASSADQILCNREVKEIQPVYSTTQPTPSATNTAQPAPSTTSTAQPAPSATNTAQPAPTTTTTAKPAPTTTTTQPAPTTTTTQKPAPTTTTTQPAPTTTTTARPPVPTDRTKAEQLVRSKMSSMGIQAYIWSAYGSPNYIVRVDLQGSTARAQEACIAARDTLRQNGYWSNQTTANWWIHVFPYGANSNSQILCNELV